jgi:hypothetical protein
MSALQNLSHSRHLLTHHFDYGLDIHSICVFSNDVSAMLNVPLHHLHVLGRVAVNVGLSDFGARGGIKTVLSVDRSSGIEENLGEFWLYVGFG